MSAKLFLNLTNIKNLLDYLKENMNSVCEYGGNCSRNCWTHRLYWDYQKHFESKWMIVMEKEIFCMRIFNKCEKNIEYFYYFMKIYCILKLYIYVCYCKETNYCLIICNF